MRYSTTTSLIALLGAAFVSSTPVLSQSSSLYIEQEQVSSAYTSETSLLSPAIAAHSFVAVQIPEPRQFVENDLVTVIIRESFQTDLKASLETEKELELDGEISEFIDIDRLMELVLRPYEYPNGETPKVGVGFNNEWEGEGDYSRTETMTGRMTARVADVKPNGTVVLEARKTMIHDKEELTIVLTGTCRAEDISIDNTVLSTELYDLHLDKQHKGELKKATKKGIITQVFDALFGF